MKRILLASSLALLLAGCAQPARVDQMSAMPTISLPPSSPLQHAIDVNSVTGGTSTNPLWMSKVDNAQFQSALQASLGAAGMLATGPARYHLDAKLTSLRQPLMGFDMTVFSAVHYTLTDSAKPVFDEDVTADFTATVSDAFVGVERLRLANEGSIKKNIQIFLDHLIAAIGKQPVASLLANPRPGG